MPHGDAEEVGSERPVGPELLAPSESIKQLLEDLQDDVAHLGQLRSRVNTPMGREVISEYADDEDCDYAVDDADNGSRFEGKEEMQVIPPPPPQNLQQRSSIPTLPAIIRSRLVNNTFSTSRNQNQIDNAASMSESNSKQAMPVMVRDATTLRI